VKNKAEL